MTATAGSTHPYAAHHATHNASEQGSNQDENHDKNQDTNQCNNQGTDREPVHGTDHRDTKQGTEPATTHGLDETGYDWNNYERWGDLAAHQHDLLDRGFTIEEVNTWSFLGYGHAAVTQAALDIPCQFRDAGFTATQGRDWYSAYLSADDALQYTCHGWVPESARQLRRELHQAALLRLHLHHPETARARGSRCDLSDIPPTELGWITSGITPYYVHLYVRAGHNLATAHQLEARRRNGDTTIEPALLTLAALRSTQ